MKPLISELYSLVITRQTDKVAEALQTIVDRSSEIELNETDTSFVTSLESTLKLDDLPVVRLVAKCIAELAKKETNRNALSLPSISDSLLHLLTRNDKSTNLQACRALGNLCYNNDKSRKHIGKPGLEKILAILKSSKCPEDSELQTATCGLLLNLLMESDELQRAALDSGIFCAVMPILNQLAHFHLYESCFSHVLLVLNLVADQMVDEWLPADLCAAVVKLLKGSPSLNISELCVEVLYNQLENDDTKLFLAKNGVCELVFDLVQKHMDEVVNENSREVLKMVCDMIVLVLTGDEAMDFLYNNGNGVVYKDMVLWLDSTDSDLQNAAILAVGNFARKDTHCIQMVNNEISKKILGILSKQNTPDGDTRLQYALLGTLRNLVIPPENKAQIISENMVDVLYPLLKSNNLPVIFKLLGTIRIGIIGNDKVALTLLNRKDFLEHLVDWCRNSDHLGVRGEACRLIAWLIKHCHSEKPYRMVVEVKDCVKCLVEMIMSIHAAMQNEAFFALKLLCLSQLSSSTNGLAINGCGDQKSCDNVSLLEKALVDADVGHSLLFLINNHRHKMEKETVENMISLLKLLLTSRRILSHLNGCKFHETLRLVCELKCIPDTKELEELIRTICSG